MTPEAADDLIARVVEAAVYREQAESPYASGAQNELDEAREALRSALPVWQPIETAPKDGTDFIALQDGDVYRCKWHEEEPDEGPGHVGWRDFSNSSFEEPTHWTPWPAVKP